MRDIRYTTRFKRDVKRDKKRSKDFSRFKEVLEMLVNARPLPECYRDHALRGDYAGSRECHLEPDRLLIYRIEDDTVVLVRIGSHADLFG